METFKSVVVVLFSLANVPTASASQIPSLPLLERTLEGAVYTHKRAPRLIGLTSAWWVHARVVNQLAFRLGIEVSVKLLPGGKG